MGDVVIVQRKELQRTYRTEMEAWERNRGADLKDFIIGVLLKRVVSDTWKKEK